MKRRDEHIGSNAFNQKNMGSYYYQATDISTIQSEIMRPYKDDFIIHEPIGDGASVKPVLEELIGSLREGGSALCVYNLGNWHWVVFAALKINEQVVVLYKDSKGSYNSQLESQVKEISDTAEFIVHTGKEQTSGVDCGPFALQNMRIMAKEITYNKDSFVENFKSFSEFCTLEAARSLRAEEFADQYVLGTYQEMLHESTKAAKLQKLRENHSSEAREIAARIKGIEFFKDINLKAVDASESLPEGLVNTIAVEIATDHDTDPDSTDYSYGYRISLSRDLADRASVIAESIKTIFPGIDDPTGNVIRINSDAITIEHVPRAPVTEYDPEPLTITDLFKNLSIIYNPSLQTRAQKILHDSLESSLKEHLPIDSTTTIIQDYLTGDFESAGSTPIIPTKKTSTLSDDPITIDDELDIEKITKSLEMARSATSKILVSEELGVWEKVQQLQLLEKTEYEHEPLVKQLAYTTTFEGQKALAILMKDLGYLTRKIGDYSFSDYQQWVELLEFTDLPSKLQNITYEYLSSPVPSLKYYTDSAIFYQYAIAIIKEKIDPKKSDDYWSKELVDLYKELNGLKQIIVKQSAVISEEYEVTDSEFVAEIETDKAVLTDLRKYASDVITEIEEQYKKSGSEGLEEMQMYEDSYISASRKLFERIATTMEEFLARLYQESQEEIGTPPCNYTVIGLGSMALKQATPYSDLEFAILTENETYKKSSDPKIREYFKNLTHLVNFRIGNLGETIIPTSKYDIDMSHLVHRGVNLDLGGKTPLGRIDKDKPYDLVQTTDKMLYYVRNEKNKTSNMDKTLPYMLEKASYVYGQRELLTQYQQEVSIFLDEVDRSDSGKRFNYQVRAEKMLSEGIVEMDYFSSVVPQLKGDKKGNLELLEPLSSHDGQLFDVKMEIYRLADRLIHDFGIYHGINGDSAWDTIDQLALRGIINKTASHNLKYAVTFATTLRLKTYLHHQAQTEDMSLFPYDELSPGEQEKETAKIFHLPPEDLQEDGRLFKYFYTALPLHQRLQDFFLAYKDLSQEGREAFFQKDEFYSTTRADKGLIHYRLLHYKEAQTKFEGLELLGTTDISENVSDNLYKIKLNIVLMRVYNQFGANYKAIEQLKYCMNLFAKIIGPEVTLYFNKLKEGEPYQGSPFSSYNFATNLKICVSFFYALNGAGVLYRDQGQYGLAKQFHEFGLETSEFLYKNGVKECILSALNNLSIINNIEGQYDKAIEYQEKVCKIGKEIHKNKSYFSEGVFLNNLGELYRCKGQYDIAIKHLKKSSELQKIFYKGEKHPNVAISLNSLGNVFNDQEKYPLAVKYFKKSLKIFEFIYKDNPNQNIAVLLNNLGNVYKNIGLYQEAIECLERGLSMQELIYQGHYNHNMAHSLSNLSQSYQIKGDYDKAIKYSEKSLEIYQRIYKKDHPDIAVSLNNLGEFCRINGQYDLAIKYLEESLNMRQRIYKEDNPDIAVSLNNLGLAYKDAEQYDKAAEYLEKGLKIQEFFYKNGLNSNIATTLNNIGEVYRSIKQYDKAIQFYEKSLKILETIFKGPHLLIEVVLNNLGAAHRNEKQYDKALEYHNRSLDMLYDIHKGVKIHPDIAAALNSLGKVYLSKEQYNKAIKYTSEAMKIISVFKGHSYTSAIKDSFKEVADKLASQYSWDKQNKVNKIAELTEISEQTIEQWITDSGQTDLCKLVISTTLLIQAIITNNEGIVSVLLSTGIDINKPNNDTDQATPLYCSLGFYGQPVNMKIVKLLLEKGAEVDKPMFDGDTPMHMAHYGGNKEAIELLLKYDANINVQNQKGETPLHCLLAKTDITIDVKLSVISKFLSDYDLTLEDKTGKTAFDIAREHCPEALALLARDEEEDVTELFIPFTYNTSVVSTLAPYPWDFDITGELSSDNDNACLAIRIT